MPSWFSFVDETNQVKMKTQNTNWSDLHECMHNSIDLNRLLLQSSSVDLDPIKSDWSRLTC